jgi:hypothetical protein
MRNLCQPRKRVQCSEHFVSIRRNLIAPSCSSERVSFSNRKAMTNEWEPSIFKYLKYSRYMECDFPYHFNHSSSVRAMYSQIIFLAPYLSAFDNRGFICFHFEIYGSQFSQNQAETFGTSLARGSLFRTCR